MRAALLDLDMIVVNVIEYDSESDYMPPEGLVVANLSENDLVSPGYFLTASGSFEQPEVAPAPHPEPTSEQKRISALEAAVDQLVLDQLMGG